MAKGTLDRDTRKALKDARKMMEEVSKADGNEAETRRRVERIFASLMGYDIFKHISREFAISGSGTTEHCDFAIQITEGKDERPIILVELKRVNIDIASKHLRQVTTYAINLGCEWILLTNGRSWQLHHVSFAQPPKTKLVVSWNLLHDDLVDLAKKFALIGYKNVKKGGLKKLWEKEAVLTDTNLLGLIFSESSLKLIRRELRKSTGVVVEYGEIVSAIRKLLNERAVNAMEEIKVATQAPVRRRRKRTPKEETLQPEPTGEARIEVEERADT